MNTTSKIKKPILPSKLRLHGLTSHKTLLKYLPKHLSAAQIECFLLFHKNPTQETNVRNSIRSFIKKVRHLHSLDLIQFSNFQLPENCSLKLIKTYCKIKTLSIKWDPNQYEALKFTLACLKHTHNLKILFLKGPEKHLTPNLTPKVEKILTNIFNILQTKKLNHLKFITDVGILTDSTHLLQLDNYRKTLKELTLVWSHNKPLINEVPNLQKHLSLTHIPQLQRLELYIPIDLKTLNVIFGSIYVPTKLKSLGLIIKDETLEKKDLEGLGQLLNGSKELKKLVLKFLRWPDIFTGLECPLLERLDLQLEFKYDHNIDDLANFLESLRHLKTLKLSMTRSFLQVESFEKNIIRLYEKVAKLNFLKVLGLNFSLGEAQKEEILRALAKCLEGLQDLEELSLDQPELYLNYGEDYLGEILRKKTDKLKRLSIGFHQEKEKKKNNTGREEKLSRFIGLLGQMKNLENLGLRGLCLNSEEIFQKFCQAVLGLKMIRDLELKEMETPVVSGENVLRFLRKILGKRGFESLVYDESWSTNPKVRYTECEAIDLMELTKKNVQLRAITIPSYMRMHMCFGLSINMFKWSP